jgi:uncharacterized protein YidB (DUF937 family)
MSLFSELLKSAVGGAAGDSDRQSAGIVEGLLEMVQQGGGVDGVTRSFDSRGLQAETSSWIGTGANRPITPDQLRGALGRDRVGALSQRAGLSESLGASAIAAILPVLIDKLTSDGRAPAASELQQRSGSILDEILGGRSSGSAAAAVPARPKADFGSVQTGSSQAPVVQDEIYVVVAGDSLSKIAKRSYGDANQWKRIFEANRDRIKNPDLIQPGWELKIPKP